MRISELTMLYERDYYKWLVILKKYLKTKSIIRNEKVRFQIKEYLLSISSSTKIELIMKITRYVYNALLYEITKQAKYKVEKKKTELLLTETFRDIKYLQTRREWVVYVKKRVFKILKEIMDYEYEFLKNEEKLMQIITNEFNKIVKNAESYKNPKKTMYTLILLKNDESYFEKLIDNYEFVAYAVDLGIKRTLRELKEHLANA